MPARSTSDRILVIARDILKTAGPGGLTFDAIARQLGHTKQAVLYWYPTKQDLLAALFLPWHEAECAAAVASLSGTSDRTTSIAHFVRAIAQFHLLDLDRFRMMYLVPQLAKRDHQTLEQAATVLGKVHPITDRLYSALAASLNTDVAKARVEAFAIHGAVLGQILMISAADWLHDPLKHGSDAIIDALVARLTTA